VTKIAGLDLSPTSLQETSSILAQEFPKVEFLQLVVDLSNESQVEVTYQKVVEKFGRIDYAVNNAAISSPLLPSTELSSGIFDRIMSVNLRGVWLCERAALKQMVTQTPLERTLGSPNGRGESRGSIVNIGSVLSHLAVPGDVIYTMSKHGLMGMTKNDALDFAKKGIRINTVCPGFVETPLVTPEIKALLKPNIDKTPMGRLAHPQEIADGVVYLASDRSSYITGSSLIIDGGYMVH